MTLNWDDLRFLLALRRAGSLNATARALKVEASTVSRRLASLEATLGAQLAARTPEGLVLNEAGIAACDLAASFDRGIQELIGRVGGEHLRAEGVVRLATTESMAVFLMRGLIPLRKEHPKIQVELVISSGAVDLLRQEADIALRLFRETNPALIARKIGHVGWSVFGSAEYVRKIGFERGSPLDVSAHPVVGYKVPVSRSVAAVWLAERTPAENIVLAGDSVTTALNAVVAGMGISVLPCFLATQNKELVRLTDEVVAKSEAYVVIAPDHKDTHRVRLVKEALAALFERERAVLSGEVEPK